MKKKIMESLVGRIQDLTWNGQGFTEASFLAFGYAAMEAVASLTKNNPVPITSIIDDRGNFYKTEGQATPVSILAGNGLKNMNYQHLAVPELVYAVGSALIFPDMDAGAMRYAQTPSSGMLLISASLPLLETYPRALARLAEKTLEISQMKIKEAKGIKSLDLEFTPQLGPRYLRDTYFPLLKHFGEEILKRLKNYKLG